MKIQISDYKYSLIEKANTEFILPTTLPETSLEKHLGKKYKLKSIIMRTTTANLTFSVCKSLKLYLFQRTSFQHIFYGSQSRLESSLNWFPMLVCDSCWHYWIFIDLLSPRRVLIWYQFLIYRDFRDTYVDFIRRNIEMYFSFSD